MPCVLKGDSALGIISAGQYYPEVNALENNSFVKAYEAEYNELPTRFSEQGYVAAQLIVAAVTALKGDVSDRTKFRDEIKNAAAAIRAPRGAMSFDRYQQVVSAVYIGKVEKDGNQLVNIIIDTIPNVSQEDAWKWWKK